jgi:hypothetical protein
MIITMVENVGEHASYVGEHASYLWIILDVPQTEASPLALTGNVS